jgi:hypothetical protein
MELLLVALGVGFEERFELVCAGHGGSFAGHGESILDAMHAEGASGFPRRQIAITRHR